VRGGWCKLACACMYVPACARTCVHAQLQGKILGAVECLHAQKICLNSLGLELEVGLGLSFKRHR